MFRKTINIILIVTIALSLLTGMPGAWAAGPPVPEMAAPIALLMDVATGDIIYAKGENEQWAPASLTKIMTLFLANEALEAGEITLDEEVPISEKAWRTVGSRMFIEVDTTVPVDELLKGITIVSGNDACVAIAEYLGGSEGAFVDRMNTKARELGMNKTNFVNPHGLGDPNHYSTAADLALLSRQYLLRFPQMLEYHSTLNYTYNGIKQQNYNGLLRYPEIDGLKTGRLTGIYNLIATGQKDGYRLLAVILGAQSEKERETDAYALLTYGFNNYQAQKLGDKGDSHGNVRVYKGKGSRVNAVLPEDLSITLLKGETPELRAELPKYLEAPVEEGQEIGTLVVETRNGEKRYPLVAETEIPRGNFLKVFFHSIWLSLRGLFG
ncbi:MAG: D-alanyl-D-alanine carboxypeptidase [Clostridia bacterium]|jgi:D-alanyl-D-alanine carboxypeptidase (penicillin-binding protein 5/6)|nr:D-alanyl-D-alanine carboxypeptidase [Clostridia bacterium]